MFVTVGQSKTTIKLISNAISIVDFSKPISFPVALKTDAIEDIPNSRNIKT